MGKEPIFSLTWMFIMVSIKMEFPMAMGPINGSQGLYMLESF